MSSFTQDIRKRALDRAKDFPGVLSKLDKDKITMNRDSNDKENFESYTNSESDETTEDTKRGKRNALTGCKSRLALLADEINKWEDDTSSVTIVKSTPAAVTSVKSSSSSSSRDQTNRTGLCGAKIQGLNKSSKEDNVKRSPKIKSFIPKQSAKEQPGKKIEMCPSFINALEAQGFYRTDDRLICDLDKERILKINDNEKKPPPSSVAGNSSATKSSDSSIADITNRGTEKLNSKTTVNASPSRNFRKGPTVRHNSRRTSRLSASMLKGRDPCQLSFMERKKLFEGKCGSKREVEPDDATVPKTSIAETTESVRNEICNDTPPDRESPVTDDRESSFGTPKSDTDECIGLETVVCSTPLLVAGRQSTMKKKSTDVNSLNGNLDNFLNFDLSVNLESDGSFGQEVLMATDDIISSYSAAKDFELSNNNTEMRKINSISELRELYSYQSCSLSPTPSKRSRGSDGKSIVSDESSSFSYRKNSSDNSLNKLAMSLTGKSPPSSSSFSLLSDEAGGNSDECEDTESLVKNKIARLNELMATERIIGQQAVGALKLCISNDVYLNTDAHMEACKVLLLSHERYAALKQEVDRLQIEKAIRSVTEDGLTTGNVTVSKMRLPIKSEILRDEAVVNYLFCLVKHEQKVYATNVIAITKDSVERSCSNLFSNITFPNTFEFREIYSDFKITVQVYSSAVEKNCAKADNKKGGHNKAKNAVSKKPKTPNDPKFLNPFVNVGRIVFSISEVHRGQFALVTPKQQMFNSPLSGNIQMQITCTPVVNFEHRAFLTVYEVITGFGAWTRYWFVQRGTTLLYWKYPDQEQIQAPVGSFDLIECVTEQVKIVGIEICARPNTFMLEFDRSKNANDVKRYLLSADNVDERIAWIKTLNVALKTLRSWSINKTG